MLMNSYIYLLRFRVEAIPNKSLDVKSEHVFTISSTQSFPFTELRFHTLISLGRKLHQMSHFLDKKMKARDLKLLVQSHTARKWQCWDQKHNHTNLTWKYRSLSDTKAHSQPDLAHKYIVLPAGADSKDHRLASTTEI